jgi:cytoskeletal protein CcmA (bactofilin family)
MFHRPKAENDQPQTDAKAADKVTDDKNARAPVEQYAQQQMVMEPQGTSFQNLKDKMFDNSKKETTIEDKKMSDQEDNSPISRAPEMPAQASAFQKPGAGPRVPGAYPGSFPGAGSSVYGSTVTAPATGNNAGIAADNGQRKLVVGVGITMSGEIESCDTLLVEGTAEVALKGASVLNVAETGIFYGTVEIDEATIAGRFEGDLTVNGRLTVKSTGSITGSIVYKELAIEAGANLDGKVSPLGGSKVASRKDGGKKFSKGGAIANDGSELPFTGTANG